MDPMDGVPQFGVRAPGVVYGPRPGAYGVAFDAAGRLLVCLRSRGRIVLPGGGLDEGESPDEGVRREIAEETGHRVLAAVPLCRARQYHTHRQGKAPVNKLCHFFRVEAEFDPGLAVEDDHEAAWLAPADVLDRLTYGSHRWAVERATAPVGSDTRSASGAAPSGRLRGAAR